MKKEYDFSTGVRGRFYRKGATLRLPISLDPPLQARLEQIARRQRRGMQEVANQLLRKEIDAIEERR